MFQGVGKMAFYDSSSTVVAMAACGMSNPMTSTRRACIHAPAAHLRPVLVMTSSPRKVEGAGKAGYPLIPMVRVQQESTRQNHRLSQITGLPCADGFTAYTRSPRGPAFLPPSLTTLVRSIASLTSAPGRQDHTTSPSASTTVRPTASMRPPHPALNVRDDAYAPPIEPGCGEEIIISVKTK